MWMNFLYWLGDKFMSWGYKCTRKAEQLRVDGLRREYYLTRGEPWVTAGTYTTRRGRIVTVEPNSDGWLDKLPFKVFEDGRLRYTVDNWGRVFDTHRDDGDLMRPQV